MVVTAAIRKLKPNKTEMSLSVLSHYQYYDISMKLIIYKGEFEHVKIELSDKRSW